MSTNFDYYKIFYYAASLGSMTLAAKELFLSQPTVSRLIQNLENDLGCSLFIRTKKGLLPAHCQGLPADFCGGKRTEQSPVSGFRNHPAGRQRNDASPLPAAAVWPVPRRISFHQVPDSVLQCHQRSCRPEKWGSGFCSGHFSHS